MAIAIQNQKLVFSVADRSCGHGEPSWLVRFPKKACSTDADVAENSVEELGQAGIGLI